MHEGPGVRKTSVTVLHGKGDLALVGGSWGRFRELEQRPPHKGATAYGLVGMGPRTVELLPIKFFFAFRNLFFNYS